MSEPTTEDRLERQRWAIATVRSRRRQATVSIAQHAEGGHGLIDTMRYRTGQPQIGRTPGFTCSSCGTRLT